MKQLAFLLLLMVSTAQAFGDMHCRFDPNGQPSSYLRYNPHTHVLRTLTGWPQKWTVFKHVKPLKGLPPYGNQGITLVVFGDVPALHVLVSPNNKLWFDQREASYPAQAIWGKIPGGPADRLFGPTLGACWTDHNQKETEPGSAG